MNKQDIQDRIKILIRPGDSMGTLQAKVQTDGVNQFTFLDALNSLIKSGAVVAERTSDGMRYKWRDQ